MRNIRQLEIIKFLCDNEFTLINVAPRVGKCRIALNYLSNKDYSNILIIYPITSIKKSWQDEFIKLDFDSKSVTLTTTASLKKHIDKKYDVVIADEIHLFSIQQLTNLKLVIDNQDVKKCIAMTGTLIKKSEDLIRELTGIRVGYIYTMKQAIEERIISDYRITVIMTELDNVIPYIPYSKSNQKKQTEFQRYVYLTNIINQVKERGGNLGLLPIFRMNIFKKSLSKKNMTKFLINKFKDERLLIFCGLTEIANQLEVPVYHSKKNDIKVKDDFCSGKLNHLSVCKMLNAGITVNSISKAIINSFDSNSETLAQIINRLTNYEYSNPDKVADIYIICTDTVEEKKWLQKGLELFEPSKITYIKLEEL